MYTYNKHITYSRFFFSPRHTDNFVAIFVCRFLMSGVGVRHCTATGWDGRVPVCEGMHVIFCPNYSSQWSPIFINFLNFIIILVLFSFIRKWITSTRECTFWVFWFLKKKWKEMRVVKMLRLRYRCEKLAFYYNFTLSYIFCFCEGIQWIILARWTVSYTRPFIICRFCH